MTDTIKELIAAGEKATQGIFTFTKKTDDYDIEYSDQGGYIVEVNGEWIAEDSTYYNTAPEINDAEFFALAANARPAIKAMQADNERLRGALEYVNDTIEGTKEMLIEVGEADKFVMGLRIAQTKINQALKDSALAREAGE